MMSTTQSVNLQADASIKEKLICRLCLVESEGDTAASDQFCKQSDKINIKRILNQHFHFLQLHENCEDFWTVCTKCWIVVSDFHALFTKAEQICDQWTAIAAAHDVKLEASENVAMELTIEMVTTASGSLNSSIDDEHDEDVKIETEFIDDALEDADDDDALNNCSNDNLVDDDDESNGDEDDDDSDESSSDEPLAMHQRRITTNRQQQMRNHKNSSISSNVDRFDNKEGRKASSNALNLQIMEYFSLACKKCDHESVTLPQLLAHTKRAHGEEGFVECCDRKFSRRFKILEHIAWHTNPDAFKCHECDKQFATKVNLKNHMHNHAPAAKREYKCEQCSNSYLKSYKLAEHIRATHSSKKVGRCSCDICDKTFSNKHVLKTHIQSVHAAPTSEICHVCARMYKSKASLRIHMQEQHERPEDCPKMQCNICGSWFKSELYLKKHISRHNQTEVQCPICGKLAPSKAALGAHIRYVHSDRKYQCTICEKAFKRPIGLKEHMAHHTGQELYNCPYCTKTFKSNANMHSHRKKAHPNEWEANRDNRFKWRIACSDANTNTTLESKLDETSTNCKNI